jgi:VPDSG-CTERM motif
MFTGTQSNDSALIMEVTFGSDLEGRPGVPDSGGTLVLLGIGLAALWFVSKKLKPPLIG